jgi:hypothetical protein
MCNSGQTIIVRPLRSRKQILFPCRLFPKNHRKPTKTRIMTLNLRTKTVFPCVPNPFRCGFIPVQCVPIVFRCVLIPVQCVPIPFRCVLIPVQCVLIVVRYIRFAFRCVPIRFSVCTDCLSVRTNSQSVCTDYLSVRTDSCSFNVGHCLLPTFCCLLLCLFGQILFGNRQ